MPTLPPKQLRFVQEYLIDLNATAAYRRAGYAVKDADVASAAASRLLGTVKVQAAIQTAMRQRAECVGVTAERVVKELARLAFSDPRLMYNADGRLKPPSEWDDDTAACVAGIETFEEYEGVGENRKLIGSTKKVKRWDKPKILEILARHLNLFDGGGDGKPIEVVVRVLGPGLSMSDLHGGRVLTNARAALPAHSE